MIRKFIVELDVSAGVTISEMTEYIQESVICMAGSKMPEDPLFDLERDSVVVHHVTVSRLAKLVKEYGD